MAVDSKPAPLEQLQSDGQVKLLDAIDNLRNQGLGNYDISLPQLVVCGQQSSGKSSVLEGLTRLRFPTKERTCTTFATELVLRNEREVKITCSIIPGADKTEAQRRGLAHFKREFSSPDIFSFPSLVEEARKAMSFGVPSASVAFSKDVLQVRYVGPELPSLTIVDLPGFIQGKKEQGHECKEMVRELVEGYMRDEKSIILAVVTAQDDPENQIVFESVKALDPQGLRTIGIITKPDTLDVGSETEAKMLRYAKNQEVHLQRGWHVVTNRNHEMRKSPKSDAERNISENAFFATGVWKSLPRLDVGIDALRSKLAKELLRHIQKELPSLVGTIKEALTATETSLGNLGKSREKKEDQFSYLISKAEQFQTITGAALRGFYGNSFFSLPGGGNKATKLRTQIQNLNIAFARIMHTKGHEWEILGQNQPPSMFRGPLSDEVQQYDAGFPDPIQISRAGFLEDHIAVLVRDNRQSGLPSLVNPGVIAELFRKQSQRWEEIAAVHLEHVFEATKDYVHLALGSLLDSHTYGMLFIEQIDPELDRRRDILEAKLKELLLPYQELDPITYDPTFAVEVEETRARRYFNANPGTLHHRRSSSSGSLLTESMDNFANSEILDIVQAYYKKAISVFVSNVAVLAIESCLIQDLASIFSPTLVSNMSDEKLQIIASESEDLQAERLALKQKLEDLRKAKRILDLEVHSANKALREPLYDGQSRCRSHSISFNLPRPQTPGSYPENDEELIDQLNLSVHNLIVTPPRQSQTESAENLGSFSESKIKPTTEVVSSDLYNPREGFQGLLAAHWQPQDVSAKNKLDANAMMKELDFVGHGFGFYIQN